MNAKDTAEIFARDVAEHEMTVLHEDGLYRHLRFQEPGTGMYYFDLVTWPGTLAIRGDMRGYMFSRLPDMFEFFRAKSGWNLNTVNPQYWAEKLDAADTVKVYSEDLFRSQVIDYFVDSVKNYDAPRGLGKAIREEILESYEIVTEEGAREVLRDFQFGDFRFDDAWEWDLKECSHQYLWCCHAIQWGIEQYDKARAVVAS